jgi:DNA-directed RNA polymerase subunit H
MAKKIKVDITQHKLVPQHEIISQEEEKKLFEKYDMTRDQLPYILAEDPVSLSIGAKPGDIVKITRKSHTATEAIVYRLVVESAK